MEAVAVIPARYRSSRFEGKVLADIFGKPMLQYVWEHAKEAKLLDEVIIACDDKRVKEIAESFGAKVTMTAKEHLSGTDRIAEVVALMDVKVVVNIQADEPLIKPVMIDSIVDALLNDSSLEMVTLMKRITDPDEINNPNVVKVVVDKNNFALYFSRAPIPYKAKDSEVKEPLYFKHIGIYGYTKDFLFTYKNIPVSLLEATEKLEQLRVLSEGFKIKVLETKYDTIGVDTPEDLERLKEYLKKNLKF
ncbi:MAG: 3-deoxy-manno-octulosonate cytidylyltransferase [Candidatus Omnitrophica bacterium]|nr:3-deoxy-manno-octulosonate cytidylyltransferase [Candidatus Omnitrophota bacterium]MCM8799581.1 3-deoxy-manno-octulosonate cytidylyltransferase [Candidatus Omnitrophota bacterium]